MLANCFSMWSNKLLLGCLSVTACLFSGAWMGSFSESALASSDGPVLLDMPIYNQVSRNDLISQAEYMVSQEINRRFDADPDLAEIELTVLGSRNGDIVPVLSTAVSRTQWEENSQVSAWTRYYDAYALIQRHDAQPTQVAVSSPSRRSVTVASRGVSVQFDRQFDTGQLSGRTVQDYVDLVD